MSSAHRNALALNNIGLQLLERGSYRQALATLASAVDVMRDVSSDNHTASHKTAMQAARDCLVVPVKELMVADQIVCVAEDVDYQDVMDATPHRRVLLRIESFADRVVEMDCAIVLYNYAAASMDQNRQRSIGLLQLCQAILAQCARQSTRDLGKVFFIGSLAIGAMMEALENDAQRLVCREKLERLQLAYRQLHVRLHESTVASAA